MVEMDDQTLTEAEAALYDRQIRLWGLDAQKRLRASHVLVAGACGVGAEVIKNLVLSGVKALDILDHRNVTKLVTCANFLSPHDSIGLNVAEASLKRAAILNPMVDVKAINKNLNDLNEEDFDQYGVVCLCSCTKDQLIRVNKICREKKILFYSGDVFGFHGFTFTDLGEHQYVEEKKIKGEETTVKGAEIFVPLSEALTVDWTSEKYQKRLKRTTESVFIMHVLQEFMILHRRRPDPSLSEEDGLELLTIKNSLLEKMGIPPQKVSNDFAKCIFGQVSPVCAVVGGILGQEIIKAVSGKDRPHNNFFFFSPQEGAGVVECFGQ